MVLSIEGVEESTSYGTAAFKIGGKLIARLKEDGESLVVGTTFEERDEMIATEPETYYITDHYLNYPWVLVRLAKVRPDAMKRFAEGRRAVGGKEQARRHKTTSAVRPKHQSLIKIRTLCTHRKELIG